MATYQKRKNKDGTWTHRAIIRRRAGGAQSASFPSKAAAQAWAGRTESAILSGEHGVRIPDLTFGDLLTEYATKVSPTKKGGHWEQVRIASIQGDVAEGKGDAIAGVKLKDLDTRAVAAWRDRRLKTVSPGTVKREWALLSTACGKAISEWHWLRTNPFAKDSGVQRPVSPPHRARLATDDELKAIYAAATTRCEAPVVLAARFALETAMRSGEILGLTAERVDVDRRVARLVDTWADRKTNGGAFTSIKNGADREVPLSLEAVRIWQETGGKGFDVTDKLRDVYWRRLCEKAGVVGLHFHDLRHTAITRLAQNPNIQVLDLARITGHKNLNQLLAYYNKSAADIALKL